MHPELMLRITESAIRCWLRQNVFETASDQMLNQPAADYCGIVRIGGRDYVHVGNSYHTFAVWRVRRGRLARRLKRTGFVSRTVYDDEGGAVVRRKVGCETAV